jgi:hypothetical protein
MWASAVLFDSCDPAVTRPFSEAALRSICLVVTPTTVVMCIVCS